MKTLRYILISLLLIPLATQGQLHIGVRGGYSISSISFLPNQFERPVYDWMTDVGLVVKHFDTQYFGFQGELNLTQRGYRSPIDEDYYTRRINTYLEMPLFMQVRGEIKSFFVHLNAGFYLSYMLQSEEGTSFQRGEFNMSPYKMNIIQDHYVDYGIPGGVGIGYDFKWGTLQTEVRFFYGLGDLYRYDFEGNPQRSPARIQNISFTYLYNLSNLRERRRNQKKPLEQIESDEINNINQL